MLIVDFSRETPKIYHSTAELIEDGLLPNDTLIKYEGLDWNNFSSKLLDIYSKRFGTGKLS